MIEALKDFPANVVAVACKGRVTSLDYETVLVPAVESALKQHDKLRLYYQIDSDFSGIDPGAMWEDFKVGMEHLLRWERIAVVTDVDWIEHTVRAFGFLMPGKVKTFPVNESAKAREWIVAVDAR
ncbi:MAG TPA: STAS/SEC14 domain-containing protein [Methylocella sp.]|nr:STAS/SEC14 domain-containing protein [Methylocella sp.]